MRIQANATVGALLMSLPRNCTELHMVLQEYASSTCYHPCNGRARTVRTQVLDAIAWQRRQVQAMLIDGWRVTATDKPDAVGRAAATAGQSVGRAGGQSDGKAGERAPAAGMLADGRMLQARRDRRGLRALRGSGGGWRTGIRCRHGYAASPAKETGASVGGGHCEKVEGQADALV